MHMLSQEIAAFTHRKAAESSEARRRVALRLSCGMDLPDPAIAGRAAMVLALDRVKRAIRRERMKALRRHWSYDLNRHIALKEAHDEIQRSLDPRPEDARDRPAGNENGARRRRRP